MSLIETPAVAETPPLGETPAAAFSLEAEEVRKAFGGSQALKGVGIRLRPGEIHALVGANGAGKSTLARVIAGHIRPDHAILRLDGQPAEIHSPRDAMQRGVAMVTQQLSLAGHLSVAENIMLAELSRPGFLNRRRLFARAGALLDAVHPGGEVDLAAETGKLSAAQRQMVEIAKAMSQNPRVIIFDEPTTSLTPFETERLFAVMENLARQNKSLVFVSHRMEEIFAVCGTVTVLRDGKNVCSSVPLKELDQARLIHLITGRELGGNVFAAASSADGAQADGSKADGVRAGVAGVGRGETILEVRHLRLPPKVADVSFSLRRGEILGLAGLVGSGRSETARAVFGRDVLAGGEVLLRGQPYRRGNPRESCRRGMVMIPEDRKGQGVIPDFSVGENIMLGKSAIGRGVATGYSRLRGRVLETIRELRLDPGNLGKFILQLSGGMQQKALLSRALLVDPEILILDEPTQGVDVGVRSDMYAILRRLAEQGLSMLFISSDFEEVLGISNRLVVLSEGRSVAEFDSSLVDEEKLTMFAAPRTSAGGAHSLICRMTERWPAAVGCWVYFGRGLVYCFDLARGRASAGLEPGFASGTVTESAVTCLAGRTEATDGTVIERGGLASVLCPRTNTRGQHLGHIGLTLPAGALTPEIRAEFVRMVNDWE